MEKISSKELEKEGWISFELSNGEVLLTQEEVDELVSDAYKWALKLNVKKLKENEKFMKRVQESKRRMHKDV